MFEFFSAFFSQRNTIKEDKQTNKTFAKRKKEVLSILKDLDDIDLNFSTKARLDIEKLDKILKDNEAIIELSFGNLLEEALITLNLIEDKAIEIKTTNKTMTDDYVIQRAIQNLK
jgi:hypothetical protein